MRIRFLLNLNSIMDLDVWSRAFSNCSTKWILSGFFFESTLLVEGLLVLFLFLGGADDDDDEEEFIFELFTTLTLTYLKIT